MPSHMQHQINQAKIILTALSNENDISVYSMI